MLASALVVICTNLILATGVSSPHGGNKNGVCIAGLNSPSQARIIILSLEQETLSFLLPHQFNHVRVFGNSRVGSE